MSQMYFFNVFILKKKKKPFKALYSSGPQYFWHQGLVSWETIFLWTGKVGEWCK